MEPEDIQTIAMRDQLWSSLRTLLPEIEQLASGTFSGTPRDLQLVLLLARIVCAELRFRASDGLAETETPENE